MKPLPNLSELRPIFRQSVSPHPVLASYIYCYAVWEQEADARRLPLILPGTGTMCVFHYRTPYRMTDVHAGTSTAYPAYVMSNRHRIFDLSAEGPVGFVAVYIRAGRFRHFMRSTFTDIHDQVLPADAIWGEAARHLSVALASVRTFAERVELLSSFFLQQLGQPELDPLDMLLDRFYASPGMKVAELAELAGCSRRHLERRFLSAYGVTPKYFGRVVRLQAAARRLALDRDARLLDAALDAGYFDQSHFIRDVRDLTGLTPSVLQENMRKRSHFYNPPMSNWLKMREISMLRREQPALRLPSS